MKQAHETDLRKATRAYLDARAKHEGGVVREEMCIENGAARIDLALVSDGLEGFELKSDDDTLGRLPAQIKAYGRVFDRLSLITGARWLQAGRSMLPSWWGLAVLSPSNREGHLALEWVRQPEQNPQQEVIGLSNLLWRAEVAQELQKLTGQPCAPSLSSLKLRTRLAKVCDCDHIRQAVTKRLLSRSTFDDNRDKSKMRLPTPTFYG